jgi:hypothetical protein
MPKSKTLKIQKQKMKMNRNKHKFKELYDTNYNQGRFRGNGHFLKTLDTTFGKVKEAQNQHGILEVNHSMT